MKIENILEEFKRICESTGIRPSEDILFESAIKLYISSKINESKKENIQSMKQNNGIRNMLNKTYKPSVMPSNDEIDLSKPTDKQIAFLKRNNIPIDPQLTKSEVRIMIDNLIKSKGGLKHEQTKGFKKQTEDY